MSDLMQKVTGYKTCSSSDTNSDMDEETRNLKRSKIKFYRKSPNEYQAGYLVKF